MTSLLPHRAHPLPTGSGQSVIAKGTQRASKVLRPRPPGPRGPRVSVLAIAWAVALGWALTSSSSPLADPEAIRRLAKDPEYKIRLQAALMLARQRDPRFLAPFTRCLQKDNHYLVRALCASGLGRIAGTETIPVLAAALKDPHDFVRKRARAAIGEIQSRHGDGKGYSLIHKPKARLFVLVVTDRGRNRKIPARVRDLLDSDLRQLINAVPDLEVARSGVDIPEVWLKRRRLPALRVDARIEKVRRQRGSGRVTILAQVKVVITRHPVNAMVAITTTESESSQNVESEMSSKALESVYQQLERQAVEGIARRVLQRLRQVKPG